MNYPDSVRFLYSLGNEVKTAKYGLERITTVLEALGHPERLPRIVHVAGTNGKGSTSAMIESGRRGSLSIGAGDVHNARKSLGMSQRFQNGGDALQAVFRGLDFVAE